MVSEMDTNLSATTPYAIAINKSKISFELAVTGAIDAVFLSLGNPVKEAIYHQMEKTYGITPEEAPGKIDKFSEALEKILGPLCKLVEIKIIERIHAIYEDFSYASKEEDLRLVDFIRSLEIYLKTIG